MTELTVTLPDELARKAKAAGLLNKRAIVRLVEEAIERRAGEQLLDAMRRLQAANVPPLTEQDVAAEVKAVRAAKKRARAPRR
jgi:post-segregation antitoxin (ccd killing protein)